MRAWLFALISSLLGGLLGASPAFAQESKGATLPVKQAFDGTHFIALEPSAGFATPLGYAGASVVFTPVRWLSLHGGVGAGAVGAQWEAGLRGRIPIRLGASPDTLDIGASWSGGPYYWQSFTGPSRSRYWQQADWLNLELSVERPLGAWVSLRPFLGVGFVLNGSDGIPMDGFTWNLCRSCGEWLPYVGVAVAVGP